MDRFSYWEEMTGQSRKVARKYATILCRLCGEKKRDTRSKRTLTEVDLGFWRTTLIFNYHAFTKERSNDSNRRSGKWHSWSDSSVNITDKGPPIFLETAMLAAFFNHKWRIILHYQFAVCYLQQVKIFRFNYSARYKMFSILSRRHSVMALMFLSKA